MFGAMFGATFGPMFRKNLKFYNVLIIPIIPFFATIPFKHVDCQENIQKLNQTNNTNQITLDFATDVLYKKYLTKLHLIAENGQFYLEYENDYNFYKKSAILLGPHGIFCSEDCIKVTTYWKYNQNFYSKKREIQSYLLSIQNITNNLETKLFIFNILEYIKCPIKFGKYMFPNQQCIIYDGFCDKQRWYNYYAIQDRVTQHNNNMYNNVFLNSSKFVMSSLNYDDDELIKLMHNNEEIKYIVIAICDILDQPINITNIVHTSTYVYDTE